MTAPFTPEQTQALLQLMTVWADRKLVVIGAAAVSCHLTMTWRRTNDIDLSIVADVASITSELRELGFRPDSKLERRWFSPNAVALDIFPVTSADLARRKLTWPDSGFIMDLGGFDLLFTHTHKIMLDTVHELEAATLPVLVVLKKASWLDRPFERQRDLQDMRVIGCNPESRVKRIGYESNTSLTIIPETLITGLPTA